MKILFTRKYKSTIIKQPNEFIIVAVYTHLPPYSLAWCLDDTFSVNFICEPETFTINLSQNRISQHAEYYFQGSEQTSPMWILQNNGTNGKIYSQKPSPDYWIFIGDEELMPNIDEFLEKLRKIENIQMAHLVPSEISTKFKWVSELKHL